MEPAPSVRFELVGGHAVLDFVNTVGGQRGVKPREMLQRLEDLLAWARQSGVLSPAEAKALAREAKARPAKAQEAVLRATAFRESLYRLFLALLEARPAPAEDVACLGAEVQRALASRQLQCTAQGCVWRAPEAVLVDSVVPRLALAADQLLTGERWKRVRLCEASLADGCGWLFLDQTRNHSRRWCDMASCGNKHKARRHYARLRAQG